jgi:hypothetical protein
MSHAIISFTIWWIANIAAVSAEPSPEPKIQTPDIQTDAPSERVILQGGDTFADAQEIQSLPFHDNGTTSGYTNNYDVICPYDSSTAPDVVYKFIPESDMIVDIDLCRLSSYDTKLYVFAAPDTLNPVDCNDDYCSSPVFPQGYISHIGNLSMKGDTTYYIVVDGYRQSSGTYTIDITYAGPCGNDFQPYFNGFPNDLNYLQACRNIITDTNTWVIDDIEFDRTANISSIHWYAINDYDYNWAQSADLILIYDSLGTPGQTLSLLSELPVQRQGSGRAVFGRTEYIYSIDNLHISLLPGRYWIGLRPIGYNNFNNYWLTSDGQGSQVYVAYPPDYPAWTPGSQVFGAEYDVAFCASGAFACEYVIGDLNDSGLADGVDVIYGVTFFKGGAAPRDSCDCSPLPFPFYAAGDVNGNCSFNGIDLTYFVAYLKGLQQELQGCPYCPAVLAGTREIVKLNR